MRKIRRILVAVKDPSVKSLPAVQKAAQLAKVFGAQLELFHGIADRLSADAYIYQEGGLAGAERCMRTRYRAGLDALAERLRNLGLKVNVTAEWDFPVYEAIVRQARRVKADLIVAECHAGKRTAPWLLHVTDWELLRTSPVPVLLVKNAKPYVRPVILAALDPSHLFAKPVKLDEVIMRRAYALSRALGGALHAMHAYAPLALGVAPVAGAEAILAMDALPAIEAKARDGFARELRGRVPRARQHLVTDLPVDAIPRIARETGAAIVVMGAVSRSGLKRLFIGNTAERTLNELTCDVLVVKPSRFVTRVSRQGRGVRITATPQFPSAYY
jgi:universal stress protein E